MAVAVEVELGDLTLFGAKGYSVTEDSTPVDPSDSTGGVGQFTIDFDEDTDADASVDLTLFGALTQIGESTTLTDGSQGITGGIVRGVGGTDGDLTFTVDSMLALLTVERQAQPFEGTLEDAFDYYLGLVDYTGGLVVDASIAGNAVVFQGWNGVAWDYMRKMAISQGAEITLASNNVVLRPVRGRIAENYRDASVTWGLDSSQMARNVEVYYYQNEYDISRLAYPPRGWNEDVDVIVVNANETVVVTYELESSLSSVVQPSCELSVDRYEESASVYSVTGTGAGSDLPIVPAEWLAEGGSLSVAIGEDTKTLIVTVVGSTNTQYSPYRIAMPSGDNNYYSSLRVIGEGVFFDKQLLTLATSVDHDKVSAEVGVTVDSEFISTLDQAHELGRWVMKRYGSPRYTISVTTGGINRLGDSGSYSYPTVGDFNALYAGLTVDDFNTIWAGQTIADFNAFMASITAGDFANQAFGNIAGARVRFGDAMFRIRTATITPEQVSYSAEEDTTVADFNDVWDGATVGDFNAEWAGRTLREFAVAPLRRSA